ncbi:MAG TPA: ABC transporter C-terminal domain-containing protein [Albitalea sp.]
MDALEAEQRELGDLLGKPEFYATEPKRAAEAQVRYAQIDEELTAALERWEALGSRAGS